MLKYDGKPMLLIFAHPDDEAFAYAGTAARYSSLGAKVYLVTATRGEAGPRGVPPVCESTEELARIRERELRCSCEVLGIEKLEILGYPDGGVASVPEELVVPRLVRLIRELGPLVVVTFDETGITGHPDHIAIGRFATEAFFSAGNVEAYADEVRGLEPHPPERLYHRVLPKEVAERIGGNHLYREEVSTAVDVSGVMDRKLRAIACHRSQVYPHALEDPAVSALLSKEHYLRVYPPWQPGMEQERELFP